jgi:hypothetical protein
LTWAGTVSGPGEELAKDGRQKVRKEVRLTKSELAHANALAARDGFSLNRWIVALINARLHGTPQPWPARTRGTGAVELHLHAIGRNLNQLARAANRGASIQGHGRGDVIEALRTVVKDHTAQVARLMAANVARWQL